MIVLSAEQTARDNRTFKVSAKELASVERLMAEIMRRLGLPDGSPIFPDSVKNALQCAREGREVLPGHGPVRTLYPYECVPVPMHIWVKLAWASIDDLGLTWQTSLALKEMRVHYIGTILLYTEKELGCWV